ncbi:extracellular solute-binding protein [bacterium]|nr:extracellular solute-binding protein [bacterium]
MMNVHDSSPRVRGYSRRDFLRWSVLAVGGVSVAACAVPQTPAAPASSGAESAQPAEASGSVGVWYFPFGAGVEDVYKNFADQFQSEYSQIKMELELLPWADRYPTMLTAIAAGEGPDVMFMTTDALIRFAGANAIVPLDDLVSAETREGYDPAILDQVSFEGSLWYLPMDREVPVWLYNSDLLEQIEWDPAQPPASWDDMRQVCERAQALGNNIYGWGYNAASSTLNDTFYPFLYQAGGRPISADGSESTLNSEAGIEALSFIVELYEKGWSPVEYLSPIGSPEENPFWQGRQVVSTATKQGGVTTARNLFPDLPVGLTPVLQHHEQWGFGALRSWAISSNSENQEAAATWINYLVRPENMLTHCETFGMIPVRQQAADEAFTDDEVLASLLNHVPYTFDEQKHKYGRDLMPLVVPEIQAAVTMQKTPEQALNDAVTKVNELFARG